VETLRINTRAGADELTIDDFDAAGMNIAFDVSRFQSGTRAVATADGGTAEAPVYSNDASPDTVLISGRNAAELFTLASPADAADLDADGNASEGLLTLARSSGGSSLYALTILNAVPATGEALTVRALGGNDTIDASAVTLSLARLTLSGGADDDTITGSPLADTILGDDTDGSGSGNDTINAGAGDDVIDSGLGDDTVTGGLGTDTYADAGGIDTFVETRDRDVFISDNRFVVGTLSPASMLGFADAFSAADEVENLAGIFNTARLTGGAAANTFTIGDVSGALSIPGNTALPAAQQWSGTITVDGRSGADRYVVTVFGLSGAVINISDTGKLGAGSDSLRVFGSDDAARSDLFLLRRGFVAAAVDANADGLPETIDRVNFTAAIDAGLTVDALAGDDRIIVDQTLIATTLRGGAGRDLFQFGQIFGAERTPPAVAPGDEISTVAILLSTPSGTPVTARLSSGPTHPLTAFGGDGDDAFVVLRTVSPINLRGEAGDDFFSVRAFEQVGGGGTTPGNTSVAGGAGSNLIEFVANAPIDIDGGEGIDTVRLLGTFRNDQYIVDASGVFGPGTTVTYTAVEILEINSGDGDDEVFIRSTPATMRVVVFGGAGSDRIAVGIPVPGSPASPLDNSLSGIAGPVLLDGGPGAPGAFGLPVALRLPTETDAPLPAGAGGMLSDEQPGDLDTVDIRATSATAALTGSMAPRLWPDGSSLIPVVTLAGLGMGPDLVQGAATVPGGISLRRLEVVDARLGSGDDTLSISAVLAGASTVIRTLGGADTINVTAPATPTAFVAIFTDAAPGELFSGAPGADRVNALTAGLSMLIETGELDDVVLSGSGDDRIAAGPGDDVIAAGAGDDLVLADSRLLVDRVTTIATIDTSGPAGADIINPGDGLNIVFADHGLIAQDSASAGRFAPYGVFTSALTVRPTIGAGDTISAFASASPLFAGLPAAASGSDIVFGGAGADRIDTGDGRDWIVADHASAQIGPVAFPDLGPLSGPPIASDAYLAQPRERLGAKTALVINPTDPTAGAGDTINSGDDADVVVAGPGSDTIDSGAGNDWVFGDSALVDPFAPRDQRFLSVFAADPAAGDADRITTGDGDDIVMGQHGADIIFAGAGDDDIIGGHNTPGGLDSGDAIDAGAGDDAVIGDNGRIDRLPGHRSPRFVSPAGPALSGSTVGSMYDADLNASVSAPAPTGPGAPLPRRILLIDASPSTPASRFGADRIAGGAGRDVILGGNADDTLRGDSRLTNDPDPALAPSLNASTDADDYVEGNAGNDTIFGDLGQDDLVGGSSDLFGLTAPDRADGSDTIFGGDGSRTAFNDAGDASASRDADVIAGDNASIFRLVGPGGLPIAYAFDASITPRVVRLLDYTTDSLPAGDTGAADLIRAESGNDTVYAMTGNDVIYGDAGDDDLIGGSGDDWIYAGSGDDAVLGDDGRLLTSRNGLAEPLFNLPAQAQQTATTPDALFTRTVFSTGSLLRSARLSNHASGGADVIFGGLGNDAIHGGGGSDALSGAQSLPEFYTPPATPPTLVFNASLRRFTVYEPGFALRKVPNFFLNFSSGPIGSPINDGADALFGGHGNDWLVGGTASDLLFGGMGDDVLNADDTLDTVSPRSGNNLPDVGADATPDIAFGGGGLDRLISGSSNDRLIDWNGEFNQYVAPYIAAYPTIIRTPTTAIVSALRLLGAGAGADTRLTEPDAELGIVLATDPQWAAQFGRPTP
jgi:Ca2+-binding RTX toxin-like protein